MEYILILDEVMDVVEQIKISTDDINILLEQEIISVDDKNRVHWKNEGYKGEFKKYYNPIKNGDVYLHNGIMILWTFPSEIFNSFKEVYILTYLFKGQIQRYYYDMNNVDYEYKSVECAGFGENKHYRLVDYKEIGGSEYKDLINLYQGKLNNISNICFKYIYTFLSNIDLLKWSFKHSYYVCLVSELYTNNEKMRFRDS